MSNLFKLLKQLAGLIPTPVLIAILAAVVVFGGPLWLENARMKEVRGLVRQISRAGGEGPEAERLGEKVFKLAADKSSRLQVLATEAHRRQLVKLRDKAWTVLQPIDPVAVARQRKETAEVVKTGDRHPLEAQVAVEQLLEGGAPAAARARLEKGLLKFPTDPGLLALREKLGDPSETSGEG
jgi:hypothetical protein